MIRLGFEPRTHSLEGCCSIQLSYPTILSFAVVLFPDCVAKVVINSILAIPCTHFFHKIFSLFMQCCYNLLIKKKLLLSYEMIFFKKKFPTFQKTGTILREIIYFLIIERTNYNCKPVICLSIYRKDLINCILLT